MASILDPERRQADPSVKVALALLRISQALAVLGGQAAEVGGVSPLQARVLLDLRAAWPAPLTAGHLAERYGLTRATLSESLAVLKGRRLVRVRERREDRRVRELFPTAAGRRVADRMARGFERLVGMAEELTDGRRAATLECLLGWVARLVQAGWIATDRLCVTCRFFRRDVHPDDVRPHHCALIDRPLGAADLRVDCPDHEETLSDKPRT